MDSNAVPGGTSYEAWWCAQYARKPGQWQLRRVGGRDLSKLQTKVLPTGTLTKMPIAPVQIEFVAMFLVANGWYL
jgi:hypothetical protein